MPVKTVTILVQAMTDRANAQIKATSAVFDELRSKSPVEMAVKFDKAQALAESRILAREIAQTVRDVVKLQEPDVIPAGALAGKQGVWSLLGTVGSGGGKGGGIGALPPQFLAGGIGAALLALPFLAQAAANSITFVLGGALTGLGVYGAIASASVGKVTVTALQLTAAQQRVAAAQDKLAAAQKSGADNTGQLDRAYAGLAAAQDHLAKVQAAWASQQLPAAAAAMHTAFKTLSSDAQNSLQQIGASFVPVLTLIAKMADVVLKDLTPAFVSAEKIIAPAFQMLSVDFVAAFDQPAVVTSIKTLAGAFAGMLKALSPQIAGDVKAIAAGFTAIFKAASSPDAQKAMAGFVFFMTRVVADSLQVIAALANVAGWIEHNWKWAQWFLVPEIAVTRFLIEHLGALRQWIYDDFILKVAHFFTSTLPLAFDILKESARIAFNEIAIAALNSALRITVAFGHLPGFLGAPWRAASALIRGELAGIVASNANAVANIQHDFSRLNGTSANLYVYTNFVNIGSPPTTGGIFPTPTGRPPGVKRMGFALGGLITEPILGVGPSGTMYALHAGETVKPGWGGGYDGEVVSLLDEIAGHLADLKGITAAAPAATGATLGAALAMGGRSAVYGALYP